MKIIHFLHNINFIWWAHLHVLALSKQQIIQWNNVKIISYNINNSKSYWFWKKYLKEWINIIEFNCKDTINYMWLPIHNKKEENIIQNYLKEEKINIIHLHIWYSPLSLSISKIKNNLSIKVFLTEHTYYTICPDNWLFSNWKSCEINKLESNCIKCKVYNKISKKIWIENSKIFTYRKKTNTELINKYINKIICPSKTLYDDLINYWINANKLDFIRHWIEKKEKKKILKKEKKITFWFIWRLSKIKWFEVLNKILNKLSYKYTTFTLNIVWATENSDIIIKNNKNYKINIIKNLENKNIYEIFYKKIDFLIVPSLWKETGPLNILEAFNFKIPVIWNNIWWIWELIQNWKNWYLYNSEIELENILTNILEWKINIKNNWFYVKSMENYTNNILKLYEND